MLSKESGESKASFFDLYDKALVSREQGCRAYRESAKKEPALRVSGLLQSIEKKGKCPGPRNDRCEAQGARAECAPGSGSSLLDSQKIILKMEC